MTASPFADRGGNVLWLAADWLTGASALAEIVSAESRLLVVSYSRPAESYVSHLRDHAAGLPEAFVVIEATHSPAATAPAAVDVRVKAPERPSLVGTEASEVLLDWQDGEAPIVVYFESITALLQYADIDEAYRFLHPFTREVRAADADGYYRLSPAAHDDSTVATFEQLFDRVRALDAERKSDEKRA